MSPQPRPDPPWPVPGEPEVAAADGRRLSWLDILRVTFLVAAIGFGWWGLREYHEQIVAALGRTSPVRVLVAFVLVVAALALTGMVWRAVLSAFGHTVAPRPAASIFFVGQLGKYIPGSVWSLGAQADMARRFRVPSRTTVTVGLVFLYVHVVSALPVAVLLGRRPGSAEPVDESLLLPGPLAEGVGDLPWGATLMVCGLAAVLLSPAVLRLIGRLLAGRDQPLGWSWARTASVSALMAGTWLLYGLGLLLVFPAADLDSAGGAVALLAPMTAAFATAHMVGVLVVVAPAGAGARELTLIALLAPFVGVPSATAAALLTRVVHTVADFAVAGVAWLAARGQGPEPGPGTGGPVPADGQDAGR